LDFIIFWDFYPWNIFGTFGKSSLGKKTMATFSPASPAAASLATTVDLYEENPEGENVFNELESLLDFDVIGDQGWLDIPLMDTQTEEEKSTTLASFAREVGKSSPGKTMEKLSAAYMWNHPEMVLGNDYASLDLASSSGEAAAVRRGGRGGGRGRPHNGYVSSTPFSFDQVKDKTVTKQLDLGWGVSTHTYYGNKYISLRRYCSAKEPFGKYGAIIPYCVFEEAYEYYMTGNKDFDPAYPRSTTMSRGNKKRSYDQI
jgi:hypothetical protein